LSKRSARFLETEFYLPFFYSKPVVDHVLNYLSSVHTLATYSFEILPRITLRPTK